MKDNVDTTKMVSPYTAEGRILKYYYQGLLVRCSNCGIQYDKEDDKDQACRYYTGFLEFDEEAWEDYPHPIQFVDRDIMRLTDPMAFSWDCCCSDEEDASEHSSIISEDGWDRGSREGKKRCRTGRCTNAGEITDYAELQMLR